MNSAIQAADNILVETRGKAGLIRLNRPRAINSLTLPMVLDFSQALSRFEQAQETVCVVVAGEGERGLCAGGDVRIIHDLGKANDPDVLRFWHEEFPLNYRIAHFSKPYVALMDGIVMGGGVGISGHGSHRIVTERTRLAMPETGIGYFPDVGATWLLPKAPGECGTWLGLTGNTVLAADAIYAGLADWFVLSSQLPDLVQELAGVAHQDDIEDVILKYAGDAGESALEANSGKVDAAFRYNTVEEIIEALRKNDDTFSHETLEALQKRSPTSLKLTLRLLRMGRESSSLMECLEREFSAGAEVLCQHDFYEGVRAAIVDKDRNPRWSPATLADVTEDHIRTYLNKRGVRLFPGHRL